MMKRAHDSQIVEAKENLKLNQPSDLSFASGTSLSLRPDPSSMFYNLVFNVIVNKEMIHTDLY